MKENTRKFLAIFLWLVVAGFFYAAIWTNEKNTVSESFMLTGFVAIGQLMLTSMFYALVSD